jgi:hypothetical protein
VAPSRRKRSQSDPSCVAAARRREEALRSSAPTTSATSQMPAICARAVAMVWLPLAHAP